MYSLESSDTFKRRLKRFQKDQKAELQQALLNLERYHNSLIEGANPLNIQFGFLHNEGKGVYAIDQKGGAGKLKQIRLYVFPDVETETLWLLTIGDKNSQKQDIQDCRDMVASIPRE